MIARGVGWSAFKHAILRGSLKWGGLPVKDLQNLEGLALSYQPHLLDILFDRMLIGIAILDREL